jgi:hypothetical protein
MPAMNAELKTLVKEAFEVLEARFDEKATGELWLQAPAEGRSAALLDIYSGRQIAFEKSSAADHSLLVVPGCKLLDELTSELSVIGAVRHGTVNADPAITRRTIENRFQLLRGTEGQLKIESAFRTRLRCFFKAGIFAEEPAEEIIGVEVPELESPRRVEIGEPLLDDVKWSERSPMRLKDLMGRVEKGFQFAESLVIEKAQAAQEKKLEFLYAGLVRLRSHYTQLIKETSFGKDHDAAQTEIESEYRMRLNEEVRVAGIRSRLGLIALETISEPIKKLRWTLSRESHLVEVAACLNAVDGSIVDSVTCALCNQDAQNFGLSLQGAIVCSDCLSVCDLCGRESTGAGSALKLICTVCNRRVCLEHGVLCRSCGKFVCCDHTLLCEKGCRVCEKCARPCLECGENVLWCREHSKTNAGGESVCLDHAVICIGCQEFHPMSRIASCGVCGQSVCGSCRDRCNGCGHDFCLNHIEKGECHSCRDKRNNC